MQSAEASVAHARVSGGIGQLGVPEGEDDLPQAKLMFDLLMLGDGAPQVPIFTPLARGFSAATAPWVPAARAAVTTVLPTPVSVPVMK